MTIEKIEAYEVEGKVFKTAMEAENYARYLRLKQAMIKAQKSDFNPFQQLSAIASNLLLLIAKHPFEFMRAINP